MQLTNTTMYVEEEIKLKSCYLVKADFLLTDYLMAYTADGEQWACLAIDETDIDWDNGTVDTPCPDGADYHFVFTGVNPYPDKTENALECLMWSMFPALVMNGYRKNHEIQTAIMDEVCNTKWW